MIGENVLQQCELSVVNTKRPGVWQSASIYDELPALVGLAGCFAVAS